MAGKDSGELYRAWYLDYWGHERSQVYKTMAHLKSAITDAMKNPYMDQARLRNHKLPTRIERGFIEWEDLGMSAEDIWSWGAERHAKRAEDEAHQALKRELARIEERRTSVLQALAEGPTPEALT